MKKLYRKQIYVAVETKKETFSYPLYVRNPLIWSDPKYTKEEKFITTEFDEVPEEKSETWNKNEFFYLPDDWDYTKIKKSNFIRYEKIITYKEEDLSRYNIKDLKGEMPAPDFIRLIQDLNNH